MVHVPTRSRYYCWLLNNSYFDRLWLTMIILGRNRHMYNPNDPLYLRSPAKSEVTEAWTVICGCIYTLLRGDGHQVLAVDGSQPIVMYPIAPLPIQSPQLFNFVHTRGQNSTHYVLSMQSATPTPQVCLLTLSVSSLQPCLKQPDRQSEGAI